MPSLYALQAPVTTDAGSVALGFQGAPNAFYDRTMVADTTYTISTTGTTGGETLSLTLRGPHVYSFASAVAITWAGGLAPTPACSASTFDRIKFEVLQDGSLLGFGPSATVAGVVNVGLFTALNTLTPPAAATVLQTSGYSTAGVGAAQYALLPTGSYSATAYTVETADGRWWGLAELYPHVKQFGVKGDGNAANVNNETAAFQTAINWASSQSVAGYALTTLLDCSGGVYAVGQLTPQSNVILTGRRAEGQGDISAPAVLIPTGLTAGKYFIATTAAINDFGMLGILANGGGSTSAKSTKTGGINIPNGVCCIFSGLNLNYWGLEALILGGGNNRIHESFFAGLFDTTGQITNLRGATTISGGDHQITNCEFAGPSQYAVSSSNLYCAGALFSFADGLVADCIFETGDIGLSMQSIRSRYVGCRFDTNAGHGLQFTSGYQNSITTPHFVRNSYSVNNTYNDIDCGSAGGSENSIVAPTFWNNGSANAKYRINDQKGANPFHNTYLHPLGDAGATAFYNIGGDSSVVCIPGGFEALPTGATPSTLNMENWYTNNTTATTITNLTDGVNGMVRRFIGADLGLTTFQNGANIQLTGGANLALANGQTLELMCFRSVWYQVGGLNGAFPVLTSRVAVLEAGNYSFSAYDAGAANFTIGTPDGLGDGLSHGVTTYGYGSGSNSWTPSISGALQLLSSTIVSATGSHQRLLFNFTTIVGHSYMLVVRLKGSTPATTWEMPTDLATGAGVSGTTNYPQAATDASGNGVGYVRLTAGATHALALVGLPAYSTTLTGSFVLSVENVFCIDLTAAQAATGEPFSSMADADVANLILAANDHVPPTSISLTDTATGAVHKIKITNGSIVVA